VEGQDTQRLKLKQYSSLVHLDLNGNSNFRVVGTGKLPEVMGQYRELVHLNLSNNGIKDVRGGRLRVSMTLEHPLHRVLQAEECWDREPI
jgi:Ran GTPase-activating protein (RanGAP) involved in mRNA processing and transport